MKLSIIVPFYNMEDSLHYCLDSLLDQDMDPDSYEIIAVDDSSTDDTYARLEEYETRYPDRVRIFCTPRNLKQGGARNLGMDHAAGEWIGFMDGDDQAARDMFSSMLQKAEETGADVVACGINEVHDRDMKPGIVRNCNPQEQAGVICGEKARSLVMNPCSMVIKIYKTAVICEKDLRFPEEIFYEDNAAAPLWMLNFRHFEIVDRPLYHYYQQSSSTTHTITEERCRDRMKAGELLISGAKEMGFFDDYREEFEAAYTKLYYVNTLFSYMPGVSSTRLGFVRELRRGMLAAFPDFRNNRYYENAYDAEEKKLISLHIGSPLLFVLYYKLLWGYRKLRKKGKI